MQASPETGPKRRSFGIGRKSRCGKLCACTYAYYALFCKTVLSRYASPSGRTRRGHDRHTCRRDWAGTRSAHELGAYTSSLVVRLSCTIVNNDDVSGSLTLLLLLPSRGRRINTGNNFRIRRFIFGFEGGRKSLGTAGVRYANVYVYRYAEKKTLCKLDRREIFCRPFRSVCQRPQHRGRSLVMRGLRPFRRGRGENARRLFSFGKIVLRSSAEKESTRDRGRRDVRPLCGVIRMRGDVLKVNYYYFIGFTASPPHNGFLSKRRRRVRRHKRCLLRFTRRIGNARHVRARTTLSRREQLLFTDVMSTYSGGFVGNFFHGKPHGRSAPASGKIEQINNFVSKENAIKPTATRGGAPKKKDRCSVKKTHVGTHTVF